jgi:putative membrane protein
MQIEIHQRDKTHLTRDLVTRWLVNALGLVLVSRLVEGVSIEGGVGHQALTVLFASAILGLVHAAVRPVLLLLTLPINVLTLGLFTLVSNGAMFWLVAGVVPGFMVKGFGAAVLGAFLLSVFGIVLVTAFKAGGLSIKIRR